MGAKNEAIFIAPNVVHCIRAAQTAHYYNFLFPEGQLRFLPGSPANDDLAPVLDGSSANRSKRKPAKHRKLIARKALLHVAK